MDETREDQSVQLRRELHRWLMGLRWRNVLKGAFRGVLAGCALSLLFALLARVTVFRTLAELRNLAWTIIGGAILLSALGHAVYTPRLDRRYREIDRRADLQDTLTTWHEIRTGTLNAEPLWEHLLQNSLLSTLHAKDRRSILTWTPGSRGIVILCTLAGLLVPALWLPNPQDARVALREMEATALAEATTYTEESQTIVRQTETLTEAEKSALLTALEEAMQELQTKDSMTGLDAEQTALLDALEELRLLYDLESATQLARLTEQARHLQSDSPSLETLLEALAEQDVNTAIESLRALDSNALSESETQAAAQLLRQLAEAASDETLKQALENAAQALESQNPDSTDQALDTLREQLQELADAQQSNAELAEAQQALEQALQALDSLANPASAASGNPFATANAGMNTPGDGGDATGGGNDSHSEDSGADAAFGDEAQARLDDTGSFITLPRDEVTGIPSLTEGEGGEAQVPYSDVVAQYNNAARAQLDSGSYPPAMQSYIEAYFTTLGE